MPVSEINQEKLKQICLKLESYFDYPIINKKEIERLFSEHLERIKLPQRKFVNLPSYKEGYSFIYKVIRDAARDAAWDAARDAAREAVSQTIDVSLQTKEFFKGYVELYKNGLFSYWVTPNEIVYVCNPKMSFKDRILHNETKEAILWENSEKYYFLNGVRVTEEIVITPAEKLNPELLIKETNAEVRKEIIRKVGMNRILQKLQAKLLDSWREYELYRIENIDIEPVHILKMKCPSKDLIYSLRVPPDIHKAYEARVWISNGKKPEEFLIET